MKNKPCFKLKLAVAFEEDCFEYNTVVDTITTGIEQYFNTPRNLTFVSINVTSVRKSTYVEVIVKGPANECEAFQKAFMKIIPTETRFDRILGSKIKVED